MGCYEPAYFCGIIGIDASPCILARSCSLHCELRLGLLLGIYRNSPPVYLAESRGAAESGCHRDSAESVFRSAESQKNGSAHLSRHHFFRTGLSGR